MWSLPPAASLQPHIDVCSEAQQLATHQESWDRGDTKKQKRGNKIWCHFYDFFAQRIKQNAST